MERNGNYVLKLYFGILKTVCSHFIASDRKVLVKCVSTDQKSYGTPS